MLELLPELVEYPVAEVPAPPPMRRRGFNPPASLGEEGRDASGVSCGGVIGEEDVGDDVAEVGLFCCCCCCC